MGLQVGELYALLNLEDSKFTKGLNKAQGLMSSVGSTIMKASMGAVAALSGSLLAAGGAGIKMAGDLEQSKIAFKTMLGSAEKADAFLKQLANFAAKTPFELKGLQDSSRKLLAFGFESQQIIPMMTAVGDAVSGLGGGSAEIDRVTMALGQMQAKGKVSAEEMMQLAELGIPAWDMLSKAIGVDIPTAMDMASKGAIPAAQGIDALVTGMSAKFGGMMEQQSGTILGMWSTLKDTGTMILTDIGTRLIETFDLKSKMGAGLEWLQANTDTLAAGITAAFNLISQAVGWFTDNIWKPLVEFWQANHEQIIGTATTVWGQVQGVLQKVWDFISVFAEAVMVIWNEWGDEILALVQNTWNMVVGVINGVLDVLTGILDVFIGLFTGDWERMGDGLKKIWQGLWDAVTAIIGGVWANLKVYLGALWDGLQKWFGKLGSDALSWGTNMMQGFLDGITGMFSRIWDSVVGFVNKVTDKVKSVLGIHSPSKVFEDIGMNLGKGMAIGIEGTKGMVDKAMAAITPAMSVSAPAAAGSVSGGGGSGGGSGGGPMVVQLILDGRVLTQTTLRYMPSELIRVGVR
jgi:tape measure domain-containing protein